MTTNKKTNKKKQDLEQFFQINQELDNYIIPLTKGNAIAIRANSIETATKLINSDAVNLHVDNEGKEYYGIAIPKHYGLSNQETIQLQTGLSGQNLADYFDLRAELLEDGHNEEEIDKILAQPSQYTQLSSEQRKKILDFASNLEASQDQSFNDVNNIIVNRIIPLWTMQDTNNLPTSLIQEFLVFINQERNQWADEDEENPKLTVLSTSTSEEQAS